MSYEEKFLLSLLITCVVEGAAAPLVLWIMRLKKVNLIQSVGIVVLVSALTLPYLWFILPGFVDMRYYVWTGETLVVLIEMLLLWWLLKLRLWQAALLSVVLNLLSYFVGKLLLS